MITPGHAVGVFGPSNSGKSSFLRGVLEAEGSGVVALAPGTDELNSYTSLFSNAALKAELEKDEGGVVHLVNSEKLLFIPFDDSEFLPSLGEFKAEGYKRLINFLRLVLRRTKQEVLAGGEPPWKVLGLDTFTGVGGLAENIQLAKLKAKDPPKALSPDGAMYYGGYKIRMREVCTLCQAIRGYGVHWVATGHVIEKEVSDTSTAAAKISMEQQMPMFVGQFREEAAQKFDLMLHSGIDSSGKHYLLWKPDMSRATKSRFGDLAEGKKIGTDWVRLKERIEEAIVERQKG
jgi:hypothetical protein